MPIITRKTLRQFWERHPDAAEVLKDWHDNAEHANWTSPQQIKTDYPSASIIGGDRVVFNIKGNNYRLVVHIRYWSRQVYIRFIGTHAEYDRINAREV
jgi:mRNA interferase HigB